MKIFKYFVINKIKIFIKRKLNKTKNIKIIFIGLTYKPNVPDFRTQKQLKYLIILKK